MPTMSKLANLAYEDDELNDIFDLFKDGSNKNLQRSGSRSGRVANISRNRKPGAVQLFADYFTEKPLYFKHVFQHRFHVSCRIFIEICYKF